MKTTRSDQLIKHFFGIPGVIDEHVRAEIGKAAIKAIVAAGFFEIIFAIGAGVYTFVATINNFESFFYFVLTLHFFLLLGVITAIMGIELHKQGLMYKEVSPQNKQKAVNKVIRKIIISIPILFVALWILNVAFDTNGHDFFNILFTWKEIIPALRGIVTYGILMIIIGRYQIRVIKDTD